MTLHKAIEAARGKLRRGISMESAEMKHAFMCEALSTLPAKPMSEEEIALVIKPWITGVGANLDLRLACCADNIRALRDAGVLYVEEKE